jgi:tetratricopeptide (TPR) repeat protein
MAPMIIFVIALLPGVLFIRPIEMRGAFVADSAAYPALAVIVVSLVAWIANQLQSLRQGLRRINLAPALAAVAIIVMGALSIQNQLSYKTTEKLWADTVDKFPRSTFALNRLGELELAKRPITQLNDRPDAMFTLDPVNPGRASVARQKIIAKAEDLFRQALAIDPNDLAATVNLGRVYEARGEWDKAVSQFYAARRAGAREVDVQFWLAEAFNGQGNSAEAIRRYQMIIQQDPNYDRAYNSLGMIYYQRGELEAAEENFLAALRINPRLVSARINLAGLYFAQRKWQQAQDEIIRAWEIEPNNAQISMNAGSMLGAYAESSPAGEKLRLLQAAEKKFREAVGIDNNFAEAWNNLGLVLAKESHEDARLRSKMKEAGYCFARAAELEPDDLRYRQNYESAKRESGLSR